MKKSDKMVKQNTQSQELIQSCEISDEKIKHIKYYYSDAAHGNNISKVRQLFQYGIPDMYSCRITIDPKTISKWLKNGMFSKPAIDVMTTFANYPQSFIENELEITKIITERAKIHTHMTMKEILQEVRPVFSRQLRKFQTPILHELWEEFEKLPEPYNSNFKKLLEKTDRMLNDKPVVIPFSSYEFKYILTKIKKDIDNGSDLKAKKVMNKLIKESMHFSNSTHHNNLNYQKDIFMFLNHIRKRSVLKNNEQLTQLFAETKSRLDKKEIFIPFRRKSFIYDLAKLIEDLPDVETKNRLLCIAQKLPTSRQNLSAYILKCSTDTNDKIGYRLVWPSMATIEHIKPRSAGGSDDLANLGIASAVENSDRKSTDFTIQLQLRPQTPVYTQRVIDKLIELYKNGIFEKIKLSPEYIKGYADTVYEQSKHFLNLDLSALNA